MTPPFSKFRISQRGGRLSQVSSNLSPRLDLNCCKASTVPDCSAALGRNCSLPFQPTSPAAGAKMECSKEVVKVFNIFDTREYPNAYEDPNPASSDLTADSLEAHSKIITAFGDKMYAVASSENSTGKELWTDFISAIRPNSLRTRPKGLTYKWCQLLRSRVIYVNSGRGISRADTLT